MSVVDPTPAAIVDERRPLLADSPPSDANVAATATVDVDAEEQIVKDVPPEKKRSWWAVFWYALFTIAGIAVLAVFIKGFIDADDVEFDLGKALKSALGGGLSGAAAMVLQVLTLMPIRTIMNYQYRYGTSTTEAARTLYADGGWPRYYQGLTAALIQGPVSRFGDTAANAGILALLSSNTYMRKLPSPVKTVFVSLAAASFRMILTPVDTIKTTMQTDGKAGLKILRQRVKEYGIGSLWYGAIATAAATFVGNYPWFATYNFLDENLPTPTSLFGTVCRQGFIGLCAAIISDTVSNSLRVVKTYRQVHQRRVSYFEAAETIIATEGLRGLFGRGLKTRILANILQSVMFSVLWKLFMDLWKEKTKT